MVTLSFNQCQTISPEESDDDGEDTGSGQGADLSGASLERRGLDSGRTWQSTATCSCRTTCRTSSSRRSRLGTILPHKVRTIDTGLVGEMDDNRAIAEESANTRLRGKIIINVGLLEAGALDLAVFAAVVADLAGFWLGFVAGGIFAADEGVEMGEGLGAVAVFGDGLVVDVVGVWAFSLEETVEVNIEFDTLAARASNTADGTAHVCAVFVEELSFVDDSQRVSFCHESISKLAGGVCGGSIAHAQKRAGENGFAMHCEEQILKVRLERRRFECDRQTSQSRADAEQRDLYMYVANATGLIEGGGLKIADMDIPILNARITVTGVNPGYLSEDNDINEGREKANAGGRSSGQRDLLNTQIHQEHPGGSFA